MLKDFLIKNNIDYRKVIELYLFILDTNSELDFNEAYYSFPEYVLEDLHLAEEELEKYKILYKKEYPEVNFEDEIYDLYCSEIEDYNN